MYIITGLGNPGEEYESTRHNVGAILVDKIAQHPFEKDKYAESFVSFENFLHREIVFLKSFRFMNESGISVAHVQKKYSAPNKNIIVIHDEIDLPLGVLRVSFDRGSGGHNGVKSVAQEIGGNDFVRIRIGIAPTDANGKAIKPSVPIFGSRANAVANFVLKKFSSTDLEKIKSLGPKVREIIECIVKDGYTQTMNKFN
jgi:PTH1 family peptidyl-tRNA hydrolase